MKKIAIILSILIMLSSFSSITYAKEHSIVNLDNIKQQTLNELQELEELPDLGFELISEEELSKIDSFSEIIKVDSVEELQKMLEAYRAETKEIVKELNISPNLSQGPHVNPSLDINSIRNPFMSPMLTETLYEESFHDSVWAPFSGWGINGAVSWRDFAFNFKYKFYLGNAVFHSVSDITTYYSGFGLGEWVQTVASSKFSKVKYPNDRVTITAKGYTLLGVEVAGFTIGAKINDTWTYNLTLVTQN